MHDGTAKLVETVQNLAELVCEIFLCDHLILSDDDQLSRHLLQVLRACP